MARNLTQKEKDVIKEVVLSGKLKHLEIVKKYKVSTATIQRIIKANGIDAKRDRRGNESSNKPFAQKSRVYGGDSFVENCF